MEHQSDKEAIRLYEEWKIDLAELGRRALDSRGVQCARVSMAYPLQNEGRRVSPKNFR